MAPSPKKKKSFRGKPGRNHYYNPISEVDSLKNNNNKKKVRLKGLKQGRAPGRGKERKGIYLPRAEVQLIASGNPSTPKRLLCTRISAKIPLLPAEAVGLALAWRCRVRDGVRRGRCQPVPKAPATPRPPFPAKQTVGKKKKTTQNPTFPARAAGQRDGGHARPVFALLPLAIRRRWRAFTPPPAASANSPVPHAPPAGFPLSHRAAQVGKKTGGDTPGKSSSSEWFFLSHPHNLEKQLSGFISAPLCPHPPNCKMCREKKISRLKIPPAPGKRCS